MAFHNKISDPEVGGTYMTLLNTIANLGGLLSGMVVTYSVDLFTFKSCYINDQPSGACDSKGDDICVSNGGICKKKVDGYYIVAVICFVWGLISHSYFSQSMTKLQNARLSEWRIINGSNSLVPLFAILIIVLFMMSPTIWRA